MVTIEMKNLPTTLLNLLGIMVKYLNDTLE